MPAKPLSGRLLNEQGIVVFQITEITPAFDGYAVRLFEEAQEYVGLVKLVDGKRTFKELSESIQDYNTYLRKKTEYEAMSDSMKATNGSLKPVAAVTVQVNRTTHDQFPNMQ